jgi:dTDP-4-amino-4,6-dideoxygalactose transaminase
MSKTKIENIQMVDLISQYENIKEEVNQSILEVLSSAKFINGPWVKQFEQNLSEYLGIKHVIACANGTDALQLALMSLGLNEGDEVIVPAFTFVATAEVIALMKLKPVMVDVDAKTFNVTADLIENSITANTKAIVPVHLFGQCCEMEPIIQLARQHNLFIVEDNAQAIGADSSHSGKSKKAGTIGDIGTTSFFPSKNLGCYGDGGALFTDNDDLAFSIRKIANHGQSRRYYHDLVGVNSRLDSIQAAILDIKLKYLNRYCQARQKVADRYDEAFSSMDVLNVPYRDKSSSHVFHQYTLVVGDGLRNDLKHYMDQTAVPAMIYYPVPLYKQGAFSKYYDNDFRLANTEQLCDSVISLPIHTEMNAETQDYIIHTVKEFFRKG